MVDNKTNPADNLGPQGTQVFEASDVHKMIAEEIISLQPENASTPALIGISPNVSSQKYILNETKIEVGRRPNSDISLNVSSVSSMHAQIIQQDGQWKLLNLLSSNGTYVNGEKVSEQTIVPGDRVAFADAEFVFALVGESASESKDKMQKLMQSVKLLGLIAFAVILVGGAYYIASN